MDKPELPDNSATDFIFAAYDDLETCRTEAGTIPWTAARLYALDHQLDAQAFEMFWEIIKAMNLAVMKWSSNGSEDGGDSDGGD